MTLAKDKQTRLWRALKASECACQYYDTVILCKRVFCRVPVYILKGYPRVPNVFCFSYLSRYPGITRVGARVYDRSGTQVYTHIGTLVYSSMYPVIYLVRHSGIYPCPYIYTGVGIRVYTQVLPVPGYKIGQVPGYTLG